MKNLQTKHCHLALFFFLVAMFHAATHARPDPQSPVSPPPRASNDGANNSTLLMLFMFFLLSFFITVFCAFYVRNCSEQYDVGEPRKTKGVEPEVLAACPIVAYSAAKSNHRNVAAECAVCLGEFGGPDALRVLPKCGHVFHPRCVDAWLASHVTCPVCRARMVAPAREESAVEIGGALQVFDESSVREGGDENENSGGGRCGNVDGCVGEDNGSSKVGGFMRSNSTGHCLAELEKSVEEEKLQVVEKKGGRLKMMKRSASYDVVLKEDRVSKLCEL